MHCSSWSVIAAHRRPASPRAIAVMTAFLLVIGFGEVEGESPRSPLDGLETSVARKQEMIEARRGLNDAMGLCQQWALSRGSFSNGLCQIA